MEASITSLSSADNYVDYMRSSSSASGSPSDSDLDHTWSSELGLRVPVSDSPISSPSLSCPPSWIFEETEAEEKDVTDNETLRSEVPCSSSPPDLTISSQSCGSDSSQSDCSQIYKSDSGDSRSDADSMAVSQPVVSLSDLHSNATGDSFGRKLHQLLLTVLREQEQERSTAGTDLTPADNHSRTGSDIVSTPEVRHSSRYFDDSVTQAQASFGPSVAADALQYITNFPPTLSPSSALDDAMECGNQSADYESSCLIPAEIPAEISPMRFEASQDLLTYGNINSLEQPSKFRVIKRAHSYAFFKEQESCGGPPKRRKTNKILSTHANERIYAHRTASLRRGDSLKVLGGPVAKRNAALVPTAPASPIPSSSYRDKKHPSQDASSSPVPIIAPPLDHVAKLPLSSESLAKRRLIRFLKREKSVRDDDGLPSGICQGPPSERLIDMVGNLVWDEDENDVEEQVKFEWEAIMGLEAKAREAVIAWLLKILPERQFRTYDCTRSPSPPLSLDCSQSSLDSTSSTATSSSSGSNESDYTGSENELGRNLFDQLQNSPDTRFHAIWMFLRFFYLATPHNSAGSNDWAIEILGSGNFLHNIWAIAIACLAISVKFHRDFLDPLIPVFVKEYLFLAPYPLTYEKLETAHRDILSLFDWRLGVTPQPIMDELWLALPSIRTLLDFEEGWKDVTQRAWSYLFTCLREPDVQRYPVSVLTTTALMKAIVRTLMEEYRRRGSFSNTSDQDGGEEISISVSAVRTAMTRAREEAEGVFYDIQALIGITDTDLLVCRAWMSKIKPPSDTV